MQTAGNPRDQSHDSLPIERSCGDGMEKPTERPPTERQVRPLKYVPREPYKAAVTPLPAHGATAGKSRKSKQLKTVVLREAHIPFPLSDPAELERVPLLRVVRPEEGVQEDAQEEPMSRETEERLREEVRNLRRELEQQAHINGEVKRLLVAALGEDMQERMQLLTQDKALLGRHVHRYAQKLQDQAEEAERLAIHCDVWRSKFLATSLMVDELASWKAKLLRRYEDSLEALTAMLEEHGDLRLNLLAAHRKLQQIQDGYDPMARQHQPAQKGPGGLVRLARYVRNLADNLARRLLPAGAPTQDCSPPEPLWTPGELQAKEVLAASRESLLASTELRLSHRLRGPLPSPTGCRHCLGEMKVV